MPTYEYQCNRCGHQFEAVQRMADDPFDTCPQCKEKDIKRLIFPPTIIDLTPRTLGSVADKNARKLEREGRLPDSVRRNKKSPVPWWRSKGSKVRRDILKNPKKYIETGAT